MSVQKEILDCDNDDCDRDRVSSTLATFRTPGTPHCPDCGEVLER